MSPPEEIPTGEADVESDGPMKIDFAKLSRAIDVSFAPLSPAPRANLPEPFVEDLQHLMQRVHMLEQGQQDLLAQLHVVSQAISDNSRATTVALDRVHKELLGDRRVTVDRRVLLSLAPSLDSLQQMKAVLPPGKDTPVSRQVNALVGIVTNVLQRLGFTRFEPAVGDTFDPARMEALGTATGPPGTVLRVLQCGYLYGQAVERPAGVLLAIPDSAAQEPIQPHDDKERR